MRNVVKAVGKAIIRYRGYYSTSIGGKPFKVSPYDILTWRRVAKGRWEPGTLRALNQFLGNSSVYCDIGAWIGPTVLYAAKLCKHVICFEPDPVAYLHLLWNIQLNQLSNVDSYNVAVAASTAMRKISSKNGQFGNTQSHLLDGDQSKTGQVANVLAFSWGDFSRMFNSEHVDFLKIDIEGSEFELIPTMQEYLAENKPTVSLSLHAPHLNAAEREEQVHRIVDIMKIYNTCLDENLKPMDIHQLANENSLNSFRTCVFTDS